MVTRHHSEPAERVLNAADRLFYAQGYSATGVNQIISEAGVARASFYQHFPSKKDLAVAYLRRRHQGWFQDLREHVNAKTDPKARLLALFDYLTAWLPESGYRGCAFLNMVSETPALGSEIQAVVSRHKSELRDYIRGLVANLDPAPPAHIADAVHVLFEGAIVESQVMRSTWPVDAARQGVRHLLDPASPG